MLRKDAGWVDSGEGTSQLNLKTLSTAVAATEQSHPGCSQHRKAHCAFLLCFPLGSSILFICKVSSLSVSFSQISALWAAACLAFTHWCWPCCTSVWAVVSMSSSAAALCVMQHFGEEQKSLPHSPRAGWTAPCRGQKPYQAL